MLISITNIAKFLPVYRSYHSSLSIYFQFSDMQYHIENSADPNHELFDLRL